MKEGRRKFLTSVFVLLMVFSVVVPTFLSVEIVNAQEGDSWTIMEPMPISGSEVAVLNDKIYTIGNSGIAEYDTTSDSWTLKNPMPANRSGFGLAVYENRIYIIGGSNGLNQIYDPATETWENRSTMPTPRTQLEANVVNSKIYLIGGKTGGPSSTVALNEVYDPLSDTWTTKDPMPFPVALYASAVVGDKIYVFGGQDEYELPNPNLNMTQIYDTTTDTWTFGASLPYVVWQAAAGATTGQMAPKRIYIMGGLPEGSLFGTDLNQIYDPETNTWSLGSTMPIARAGLHVAVVNDVIYSMGGVPYINVQATWTPENYRYTPIDYIPEFPSWTILALVLTITLFSVVVKRKLYSNVKF
jgi:N-acetylneuraminic acid mutarotase